MSKTEGRFKVEVNTYGDPIDAWTSNALRFDTTHEAVDYARDLHSRWTAVKYWRIYDTLEGGPLHCKECGEWWPCSDSKRRDLRPELAIRHVPQTKREAGK